MYKNYYKKQIIKNIIISALILLFTVLATNKIYYKFKEERNVDYNSNSLDVIFHEKTGDKVTLTKITPVTDSVGLSSNSYKFTIKNNLTTDTNYTIKLVDDIETIQNDYCQENQIPKEVIKVSIKEGKENKIYTLTELEDFTLKKDNIKALDEKEYIIRVWTSNEAQAKDDTHYHGIIQIIGENTDLAKAK